jgi:hypothetical protein
MPYRQHDRTDCQPAHNDLFRYDPNRWPVHRTTDHSGGLVRGYQVPSAPLVFRPRRNRPTVRPYVYASSVLPMNARFCRDEVRGVTKAEADMLVRGPGQQPPKASRASARVDAVMSPAADLEAYLGGRPQISPHLPNTDVTRIKQPPGRQELMP